MGLDGENDDMAAPKDPKKAATTRAEYGLQTQAAPAGAEPVNSEQLEAREAALEGQNAAVDRAPGPDLGELEERAAEAENRAEAAERQNASLAAEMQIMREQLALLMRGRSPQQRPDAVADFDQGLDGGSPMFDEHQPHGIVVGDTEVAYVQDGHQFGRDRQYLRTEKHRGSPRNFNPRLVGWVKPRAGVAAGDALDGFRGND
jgi:hypothetical protein